MAFDFNKVLNTKVADVEKPPLPPLGSYKMIVQKFVHRDDIKGKDGTEYEAIDFTLRGIEPGPDVDLELLAAFGEPKNIVQSMSFMFNKSEDAESANNARTLYRLRNFLEKTLGLTIGDDSLKAVLPRTVNQALMANIQYEPDKNDPENMFARIKSTGPVE